MGFGILKVMKIFIGADHGGFVMKEYIKGLLVSEGHEVVDVGNSVLDEQDDYVDFAQIVARSVAREPEGRGILLCRNGMGMSIVANRFPGIRCGLAFSVETAIKGRTDDDINVLSLPSDYIDNNMAKEMVEAFLTERFNEVERYIRRINKIDKI